MKRRGLDAVTLDLWYTLVYESADERARRHRETRMAWVVPLRAAGVAPARAGRLYGAMLQAALASQDRGTAWTLPEQAAWIERRVRRAVDVPWVAERLERSVDHSAAHPTPGALDCLRRLRDDGLHIGLVSNITTEPAPAIRRLLGRLRLTPWFDHIVLSNELGRSKPDPFPFRECLRHLRSEPGRALHVGDLPADIEGARRAGMRSILYTGADPWSRRLDRQARRGVPADVPRLARWSAWREPWLPESLSTSRRPTAGRRGD
jgi:HAD superfamily hydrolase (TIGR01509 family)